MITAFVLITTKAGKEKEVKELLEKYEQVKEVQIVYGDFDMVAKIEAKTMDELNNVILDKVRNIPEISITSTLVSS